MHPGWDRGVFGDGGCVSLPSVQQVPGAGFWMLNNGYQPGRSMRACVSCVLHPQSYIHTVTMTSLALLSFFSFGAEGATSKLSSVQYAISLTLKP